MVPRPGEPGALQARRVRGVIPLAVPNIGPLEGRYLQECVDTSFVSSVGPFVDRFEAIVAEHHRAPHPGVATAAGTMALHAAFLSVGVRPGDLVIAPDYTFIATCNAIAHAGATPWLFDVTEARWTLDPDQVAGALKRDCVRTAEGVRHEPSGRRVAAICPVYTLGTLADMARFGAIARDWGLALVADAAAAVGVSKAGGAGLAGLADLTAFSFNGNKTITTGGGGMLIGTDAGLLAKARHLTTTARVGADYLHDVVGYNYRMTNMSAAVGCAQMERLDDFLAAKRRIRERYDAELGALRGLSAFPRPEALCESAFWFSGVVLGEAARLDLAGMVEALKADGVGARPFWRPMRLQPPFAEAPAEPAPVTDRIWRRVLTLPCSTGLTEAEQARTIAAVRKACG